MAGPPVLTVLLIDAQSAATAVERRGQNHALPTDLRVVGRPDSLRDALAACSTPFVSVVPAQDVPDWHRLERHVEALQRHPVAALTVAWPRPIDGLAEDGDTHPLSRELDGRSFGRAVLFGEVPVQALASVVLLRTTTVGQDVSTSDTPSASDDWGPEWMGLLLGMLTRGSVWQDLSPTNDLTRPEPDAIRPGHPAWLDVMAAGTDAGLLNEPSDHSRALIHHTQRLAELLDRPPGVASPGREPVGATGVHDVIRAWVPVVDRGFPEPPRTAGPVGDWLSASPFRARRQRLEKFIIVAPDYTEIHGGVVALHRLCDRLNAIGYQGFIEPIGERGEIRPGWRTPLRRGRTIDDAVVIYPEIVTGNLCGARRVVRWLLNRPAWFTGSPMEEGPDDLIVAFNTQISSGVPVLTVPLIDPTIFFPKDRPGEGALLWIGKGVLPDRFDRRRTDLITDTWPTERAGLATILRRADVLYTCDWLTSVIDEALMCGTQVVLVGNQIWSREEVPTRPGLAWEDEVELDRGREQASLYFHQYMASLGAVDAAVEQFVQLVNDHFDRVESGVPVANDDRSVDYPRGA